jgi:hypothetical protein
LKRFFYLPLLFSITSSALAQGLTDEKRVFENQFPSDNLQIPPEICAMPLRLYPSPNRPPYTTTFCDFATRLAARILSRGLARPLPMVRWKPPGQLVEMAGIPIRAKADGEITAFLFKNSGGALVLGGVVRNAQYTGTTFLGGDFVPPEGDFRDNIGQGRILDMLAPEDERAGPSISIPMKREGGTYIVPVLINNVINLDFVVDSGAADVTIPGDVLSTLVRAGTISNTDFVGTQTYRLPDGSTMPSTRFRIRSLKVGNTVVEKVTGAVAPTKGSLLLGQSFLSHFKSWSIDNTVHVLVLSK